MHAILHGGICIATAIIFQKSTVMAGLLGLVVAVYVSIAEYYSKTMDLDGDLKPQFKMWANLETRWRLPILDFHPISD